MSYILSSLSLADSIYSVAPKVSLALAVPEPLPRTRTQPLVPSVSLMVPLASLASG